MIVENQILPGSALLDVYSHLDFSPVCGDGVYLCDSSGREYIDFYGGHAVALLGYGHDGLLMALRRQAEQLFFQSNVVALDKREEAAGRLLGFSQSGLARVFFVNSGAEANENALRIACRKTGRKKVVTLEGGFHGRTAAAAAASWGSSGWYGFPGKPFETAFVEPDNVAALDEAVDKDAAAIIMEPVMGMAGAVELSAAYLAAARAIADDTGAVLIFDEVQSGMGRSGKPFAGVGAGTVPDILTVAKGLAGGFPAGALMINESLTDCLARGDLGTTFGGGPMACALITAVVDAIEKESLLDNVNRGHALIRTTCVTGPVEHISGAGFLLGLHCAIPAVEVQRQLLDKGVVTGLSKDPSVLRLLPPLTLGMQEIEILSRALASIN